jgi:uncharacterized membrane protein
MISLRPAASALLVLGWIAASHLGSIGRGPVDLHVAVAVAPFLVALAILFARVARPALKLLAWLTMAALLWGLWPLLRTQVALLYYLQHLGMHLAMAALFGASLLGSGEALVTRMARFVSEGDLSPHHLRYTRQVTAVWAMFFVLNALVSTALFLFAPREVWSLHANVLTGPLVGLLFLIEMLCRRAVLLPHERPSLSAVMRAWRTMGQQRPTDPRSQP